MYVLHQFLFAWSQMWPTASNVCNIDWSQKVDPMRNSLVLFLSASWQQMKYWIYWRQTYLTLKIAMMTSSMWHSFLHRSKPLQFHMRILICQMPKLKGITHLPRRLLRSSRELTSTGSKEPESAESSTANTRKSKKKRKIRNWKKCPPKFVVPMPLEEELDDIHSFSPLEYSPIFFSDELVEHIVNQTNLYSQQKGRNVNMKPEELLGIVGLFIYSGYRPVHDKTMLWSLEYDAMQCNGPKIWWLSSVS